MRKRNRIVDLEEERTKRLCKADSVEGRIKDQREKLNILKACRSAGFIGAVIEDFIDYYDASAEEFDLLSKIFYTNEAKDRRLAEEDKEDTGFRVSPFETTAEVWAALGKWANEQMIKKVARGDHIDE